MTIAQKLQAVLDIKQSIRTVLGIEPSVPFSQYPSIIEGAIEQGPSTGDGGGSDDGALTDQLGNTLTDENLNILVGV